MITKIQSISDIITNSSSEVFVVSSDVAETIKQLYPEGEHCINIAYLNYDWVINFGKYETELLEYVFKHIGLDISTLPPFIYSQYSISEANFKNWVENNREIITEKLKEANLVYLDIEDHFNSYDFAWEDAQKEAIYADLRH